MNPVMQALEQARFNEIARWLRQDERALATQMKQLGMTAATLYRLAILIDPPNEEIAPPRSWPKDAWSLFEGLPSGVQKVIAARERQRDAAVRRAQTEVELLKKEMRAAEQQPPAVEKHAA